ncbi:MAG: hypothetical protein OXU67_06960 [Chloroflexota bacterium]|nr:hypothetical protein [Chloroflexota bacterium]
MKGRYMERRYHGYVGASVLGWSLIAIGVVALAPQLGGVLFGGLVGAFAIVVPLLAIALAVVIVLGILGLTGAVLAAPFVALVGVPVMLLRALFRSGGPPSIDAQRRRERTTGRGAPPAQSPASQDAATEVLRQRYAAGQLSQGEFQGMLINLLKERYIAGKIDQNQYEKQLEVLLQPPPTLDKVLRA